MTNITLQSPLLLVALLLQLQSYTIKALIVGNIKIVGQAGGVAQFLPGSYINTIPRWTVEEESDGSDSESNFSLKQLIGTGSPNSPNTEDQQQSQYVNPTSNEELWWPADIRTIQIRPTLDIFIKSGAVPSYVLAGVETRVPSSSSKDGHVWKNFGMNSQPIASQWTDFSLVVEDGFRVETFIGTIVPNTDNDNNAKDQVKEEKENSQEDDTNNEVVEWEPLYNTTGGKDDDDKTCHPQKKGAVEGTLRAIETLATLLANVDDNSPLSNGMHIISIPITDEKKGGWVNLPLPIPIGNTNTLSKLKLLSLCTVEQDAMELYTKGGEDLVEMSATSVLNVNIEMIAAGSESEFIPDVYRPLYIE
jgi:hypothetical protein